MKKTAVAFAAHPDDLEFTCTGTISKLIGDGYKVIYAIVTNGENGFKTAINLPPLKRAAIRKKEQLVVAEKLGISEVIFLDYKDGFLEYTEELRSQIVKIIKSFN